MNPSSTDYEADALTTTPLRQISLNNSLVLKPNFINQTPYGHCWHHGHVRRSDVYRLAYSPENSNVKLVK